MGDVVTSFHEVKQLFLIPIPGVLTQNLGNIVRTWSALWSLTVCVLFLRLCYSGITFYQQCDKILFIINIFIQIAEIIMQLIAHTPEYILWPPLELFANVLSTCTCSLLHH